MVMERDLAGHSIQAMADMWVREVRALPIAYYSAKLDC